VPLLFTHLGMLDHIERELPQDAQSLIATNHNFACFGSMGPDYLYFYERDWPFVIGKFSSLFIDVTDFVKEINDLFREIISVFDATKTAAGDVADWISGGLFGSMQTMAGSLSTTARAMLEKFVLDQKDFFEVMRPPINIEPAATAVPKWWWADIAHHRNTADFARALWQQAAGDDELMAYCLGYFTHMGVDLVGHTYVNLLTGGPYRNHWRRHGFIERILDTHLWQQWQGESVFDTTAHERIKFETPTGEALPDKLAAFIASCLRQVYGGYQIESGVPDAADVKHMYRIFFEYLEKTCSIGTAKLAPPPDFKWFDLPDFMRDHIKGVLDQRPAIGNPPSLDPADIRKWKAFLASLIKYAVWLMEVSVFLMTIPAAMLSRLSTTQARYVLWLSSQSVYELNEKVRLAFVVGGYLHPEPEQVERYFRHVISPPVEKYMSAIYPYEHAVPDSRQTYHLSHPMDVPGATNEAPESHPMAEGGFPAQLPFDVFTGDPPSSGFDTLKNVCDPAGGPIDGRRDSAFISAKWASVRIIEEFLDNGGVLLPNWNLDGDRGAWEAPFEPWHSESDFKFQC
jgi:hypothetical protein